MSTDQPTALVVHTLDEGLTLSQALAKASPILPKHCKDAPSILAVVLAGQELGLPPMLAMRSIHLVEGRPVISADMQLALAARAGVKWSWVSATAERAELHLTRPGWPDHVQVYTIEMAKRAGLAGKNTWKAHPEAMLRARCVTSAMRSYCPDILTGVLDPDEEVEITSRILPTSGAKATDARTTFIDAEVVDAEVVESTPDEVAALRTEALRLARISGRQKAVDIIEAATNENAAFYQGHIDKLTKLIEKGTSAAETALGSTASTGPNPFTDREDALGDTAVLEIRQRLGIPAAGPIPADKEAAYGAELRAALEAA